jgi:hypothetical protein
MSQNMQPLRLLKLFDLFRIRSYIDSSLVPHYPPSADAPDVLFYHVRIIQTIVPVDHVAQVGAAPNNLDPLVNQVTDHISQ